ncbi:hypothetical protein B484DRAFT_445534 [Ochromonadaceae sp. CCMP2298]|nr:hypothetical protein B484DRAFT_445534 [Ochromonadaceae sp. CCMP2298]
MQRICCIVAAFLLGALTIPRAWQSRKDACSLRRRSAGGVHQLPGLTVPSAQHEQSIQIQVARYSAHHIECHGSAGSNNRTICRTDS